MAFLKGSSSTIREELDHLPKAPRRFYWYRVVMTFIEREFFHDKRRNLTVYKRDLSS
jgi:hypothetical protein